MPAPHEQGAEAASEAAGPPTAAAPGAPKSAPASLFEEVGGPAAMDAAVDLFYQKVIADAELAPFFEGVDMRRQRSKQVKFLSFALGGPESYKGPSMGAVHRRLVQKRGLRNRHFDLVVSHLGATLAELGVKQEVIARAAAVVESTRPDFGFPVEEQ